MSQSAYQAYWKYLQLGDFLQQTPSINQKLSTAGFLPTTHSDRAIVRQSKASMSVEYSLRIALYRTDEGTRAFIRRLMQFLNGLRNAANREQDAIAQFGGDLCIFESGDEFTTLTTDANSAASDVIVAPGVEWAVNDYAYLTDGAGDWEVRLVTGVAGNQLSIDPTFDWVSGTKIGRVLFYIPRAHITTNLSFKGDDASAHRMRKGVDLVFTSVEDPAA